MTDDRSTSSGLPARLRAARERAGLSQGQVAKLLDMQRPTISEIEAGRRKVTAAEVVRFAEAYNASVSWLLNEQPDSVDPMVELAARELSKLKKDDLDTVLELLKTLRKNSTRK